MDEAKKERTKRARLVTRRINELSNCVKTEPQESDVLEKTCTLKYAIGELGTAHDEVTSHLADDDGKTWNGEEQWYQQYDIRVNTGINEARTYIRELIQKRYEAPKQVNIKKLDVPVFDSNHRNYNKWKKQFEGYTKHLDEE